MLGSHAFANRKEEREGNSDPVPLQGDDGFAFKPLGVAKLGGNLPRLPELLECCGLGIHHLCRTQSGRSLSSRPHQKCFRKRSSLPFPEGGAVCLKLGGAKATITNRKRLPFPEVPKDQKHSLFEALEDEDIFRH